MQWWFKFYLNPTLIQTMTQKIRIDFEVMFIQFLLTGRTYTQHFKRDSSFQQRAQLDADTITVQRVTLFEKYEYDMFTFVMENWNEYITKRLTLGVTEISSTPFSKESPKLWHSPLKLEYGKMFEIYLCRTTLDQLDSAVGIRLLIWKVSTTFNRYPKRTSAAGPNFQTSLLTLNAVSNTRSPE